MVVIGLSNKSLSNKKNFLTIVVLVLLLVVVLSSCNYNNSNYLVKDGEKVFNTNAPVNNDSVRPDIPRETSPGISYSHDYDGSQKGKNSVNKNNYYSFLNSINSDGSFTNNNSAFRIGNADEPFIIGKKLGDIVPYLTGEELSSFIGKPAGFGLEGSGFGSGSGFKARQYLRFDFGENSSGVLRFSKDEGFDNEENNIGVELFFKEDKPIFELAYLLEEGNFPSLVGEEISFFGEDYVIQEANNNSLLLFGRSTKKYISLSDGHRLSVNGVNYGHTIVNFDAWHFTIRVFADTELGEDGLVLKPGESLRDKLPSEVFMNDYWNLYFDGVDNLSLNKVEVTSVGKKVKTSFVNRAGENVNFLLLKVVDGNISLSRDVDGKHKLHLSECKSSYDYCIKDGDSFLLTDNNGISRIFDYRNSNERADQLYFFDNLGEKNVVKTKVIKRYDSDFDLNNDSVNDMKALRREGFLMFENNYNIFAYYNESSGRTNVSLDFDASGNINGELMPIMLEGEHKMVFNNDKLSLTYVSRNLSHYNSRNFVDDNVNSYDELVNIFFVLDASDDNNIKLKILKKDLDFKEVEDSDEFIAMSTQGVLFNLKKARETSDGLAFIGKSLIIDSAPGYREGIVMIKG